MIDAGTFVFVSDHPEKFGITTGNTRDENNIKLYGVNLPSTGEKFFPSDQLIQVSLVRLIADPGRMGVPTKRFKVVGERTRWEILIQNERDWHIEGQIEPVPEDETPLDQLTHGRFGKTIDLRRNLTFVRLNGRLADLIYSMETTNTDYYAYQFKPVLDFLASPTGGLLIADEVGLGKTIEAGLIWTEIRSRFDAKRLMVLCPAMLRDKWKEELRSKFGIEAVILKSSEIQKYFEENLRGERKEFCIIASMQGLRPRRGWDNDTPPFPEDNASELARFLKGKEYENTLLDLLIIDEAHYLRNPESMTSELGQIFKPITDHLVLLSATPIHLKNRDLFQLLNLVDEDAFNRQDMFDETLEANRPLIKLRDNILQGHISRDEFIDSLKLARSHPFLEGNRQIQNLIENTSIDQDFSDNNFRAYIANRIENINLLGRAVTRTRKKDVIESRVIRDVFPEHIPLSEPEYKFYEKVTNTVRQYCENQGGHPGFILVTPQRQMSSCMPAALKEWQKRYREGLTDNIEELMYEDVGRFESSKESPLGPLTSLLAKESANLANVDELTRNDSKYKRLKEILLDYLNRSPDEKVVIFAIFRPTLFYLEKRLKEDGITCITLMGGTPNKTNVLKIFKSITGPQVLLSSEVASEGIDLQFSRVLINYDLPWNPMRVEQRIGRIDRLGQKASSIKIWNLFYKDTIDSRIYSRLFDRLDIFKNALGDIEEVLGNEIQNLTLDLMTKKLTPEQEITRIKQTEQALANKRQHEERLEEEAEAGHLIAHGEYILNQVKAAHELQRWITGGDLWNYFSDYLEEHYRGSEFIQLGPNKLLFDIKLSEKAQFELEEFLRRRDSSGVTSLTDTSTRSIKCLFDNKVGKAEDVNVECINQFHPLIRFTTHKIKERGSSYYHRTVAIKLNNSEASGLEKGVYVFFVQLWEINALRDIEKLKFVVKNTLKSSSFLNDDDAEKLVTTAAMRGEDLEGVFDSTDLEILEQQVFECMDRAENSFSQFAEDIRAENNDRADFQAKSRSSFLKRKTESFNEVYEAHRANNRASLAKATLGKIEKLKERIRRDLLRIERGRNLKKDKKTSCLGIIEIY